MSENDTPVILPGALCMGLIFMPYFAMCGGADALAGIFAGTVLAGLTALLSGYMRIWSKALYLPLLAAVSAVGGLFLRLYSGLISRVLLPEYPVWPIGAALLLTVLYGEAKGKNAVRRFAWLSGRVLIAAVPVCLIPAAKNADIRGAAVLPQDAAAAADYALLSCFLLALPLTVNYTQHGKTRPKAAALSVLLAGVLSAAAALIWQARFGYISQQPVLDLMYAGGTGSFIRRQEGLILAVITLSAYSLLEGLLRCAAFCAGFGKAKKGGLIFCAALLLGTMFYPASVACLCRTVEISGAVFLLGLPLICAICEKTGILKKEKK